VFPWTLVLLFVVLPLAILVDFAPVVAFIIIVILASAPFVYDRVDT